MAYWKLNKEKPIKMESTRNKITELGRPELSAGSMSVSEPPGPECLLTNSGAGASKSPKSSHLGRIQIQME